MGLHCGSASSLASNFAVEQEIRKEATSKMGVARDKELNICPFYEDPGYTIALIATDWCQIKAKKYQEFGLPSTIRTCDLRLRRALLYPAELWAEYAGISRTIRESGRSTRIRTLDPLLPKQVRYQAALHSDGTVILHRQRYLRQIL